jgi:hypothetical protein
LRISTVTIEMRNLSTDAWIVTDVRGASGVTEQGAENPTLRLDEGVRYVIVNSAGRSAHPFALQDASGTALLRQDTGAGTLSDEQDINFTADADGVAFTFTRSLSQEAATYNCLNHPAMEGTVVAIDSE